MSSIIRSRLVAPGMRRGLVVSGRQSIVRGGHGGPAPPPFQRLPVPTKAVHEETELLWDDGVAPELALDFDAQNYSKFQGFAMWAGGLGFFASLFAFLHFVWDAPGRKRTVKRELPYDNLSRELGGFTCPERTM